MNLSFGILYTALLIPSAFFTIYLWKRHKFSAFGILNASFILYYILTPMILLIFPSLFSENLGRFTSIVYNSTINQQIKGLSITIVAYLVIVATYFLINMNKSIKRVYRVTYAYTLDKSMKIIYHWGLILFFIGSISISLFFVELGGISAAISFSNSLRGLGVEPENYYGAAGALFRMLSFLILGSVYCFKIYTKQNKSMTVRLLLWSSYFFSGIYLVFNAGRLPILFFLIPFILEYFYKRNKNLFSSLILLFIGTILFANLFDLVLLSISSNNYAFIQNQNGLLENLVEAFQDLSYPYSNILMIDSMNETYGFRFGQDYFIWIFDILPSRLFSIIGINIPETISINSITSMFHYSLKASRGGVPTDIITLGMRQLGVAGVTLNMFVFSLLALYVDKLSRRTRKENFLLVARIDLLFFSLISNNDLTAIVRGSLYIILLVFILKKVSRIKKNPENELYFSKGT